MYVLFEAVCVYSIYICLRFIYVGPSSVTVGVRFALVSLSLSLFFPVCQHIDSYIQPGKRGSRAFQIDILVARRIQFLLILSDSQEARPASRGDDNNNINNRRHIFHCCHCWCDKEKESH